MPRIKRVDAGEGDIGSFHGAAIYDVHDAQG
jgi:hypothetical protein